MNSKVKRILDLFLGGLLFSCVLSYASHFPNSHPDATVTLNNKTLNAPAVTGVTRHALLQFTPDDGANQPALTEVGLTRGYMFQIGDVGHLTADIPHCCDTSQSIEIEIHYAVDEAYATNSGEIQFEAAWGSIPEDGTESIAAPTHSGTLDSGDININATANYFVESSIGTIAAANLADGDYLTMELERVALDDGNNPTADVLFLTAEAKCTMSALGE
jgi:hypothetical protein